MFHQVKALDKGGASILCKGIILGGGRWGGRQAAFRGLCIQIIFNLKIVSNEAIKWLTKCDSQRILRPPSEPEAIILFNFSPKV